MTKDNIRLLLRSFNNECDASINNVKFNNVETIETRIRKAFQALNKLGERNRIEITLPFLELKLQELHLCYEYQVKKQEEKEEQKRIREQMREEARLAKEVEEERQRVEKEEKHFCHAMETLLERLKTVTSESEKELLEAEKVKIEANLAKIEQNKLVLLKREQNTRAGYVYIISNIGSFGENIYKIGVTRRLEPEERIDELGDASVPFDFDIHAMIFSEDAPALETALHTAFANRKLNMINNRREFFNVTLQEIESVTKKNFKKPVEFTLLADAAEYRQSLQMRKTPN